jgi:HTH-type transcriptional regulator/antitoxin HigA
MLMHNGADRLYRLESVEVTGRCADTLLMNAMPFPSSNIDLENLAATWRDFQSRTAVKFCIIENEAHYRAMVDVLNELIDEIGDRESHSMMGLLDIVSFFVYDYEERTAEIPNSEPHSALRFFMEQHNLHPADLADIFGSYSNVVDVLNGKRKINPLQAGILAARFHVSDAVFIWERLNEATGKTDNAHCG